MPRTSWTSRSRPPTFWAARLRWRCSIAPKPETSSLIHETVTETYYIVSGSGTIVTGGKLGDPKPTDLTRVNAGMSQTGTRIGGESRKVKPGDIVIVPAGTPHGFSELDGPISYLVYRFGPTQK